MMKQKFRESRIEKNITLSGSRHSEAQEAYRWEKKMHRNYGVIPRFGPGTVDIELSVHLIHEISELLEIKPPKYYFYDGSDTNWGGYANGKRIVLRTDSCFTTAIHEMAHYIDNIYRRYKTGEGHGDSFKQILSLLYIELGYWPMSSMSKSDYLEAYARYMPTSALISRRRRLSQKYDQELDDYLKEKERQEAEAEAKRKEAEAKQKEWRRRKSVISAGCMGSFSEWFDFQMVEDYITKSIGTGDFPVLEYYFVFGDSSLEFYYPWRECHEDDWFEECVNRYVVDCKKYITDQQISSFDQLVEDNDGLLSLFGDFVDFVIADFYEELANGAYDMEPDLIYILCDDAFDEIEVKQEKSEHCRWPASDCLLSFCNSCWYRDIKEKREQLKRVLSAHKAD